jgi:hypothetical protein
MSRGIAVFAGIPPEVIRASAREAEALGYRSFWVNHPPTLDGLAALAVAARETRRIEVGVGVIPLHNRGPESIIEGVRTNALPLDGCCSVSAPQTQGRCAGCERGSRPSGRWTATWSPRRSVPRCAGSPGNWPTACSSTG